ncbi:MAG: hypothetical protein IT242_10415, partial [Bacteroidia bacterium]|nr:hypothetical protein [Bacteroidia bacterium]
MGGKGNGLGLGLYTLAADFVATDSGFCSTGFCSTVVLRFTSALVTALVVGFFAEGPDAGFALDVEGDAALGLAAGFTEVLALMLFAERVFPLVFTTCFDFRDDAELAFFTGREAALVLIFAFAFTLGFDFDF